MLGGGGWSSMLLKYGPGAFERRIFFKIINDPGQDKAKMSEKVSFY